MVSRVKKRKSQIGRHKQSKLGRLKLGISTKWAMRARQSHQGRLKVLKHTKAITKQTDK